MELKSAEDVFDALNTIYDVGKLSTGDAYIRALIENVANYLGVSKVFIGKPLGKKGEKLIRTLFVWDQGKFIENFDYHLKNTPCENVLNGDKVCIHPKNAFSYFPKDLLLKEAGVEAYLGAPVFKPDGSLFGLLVILDNKEFQKPAILSSLVELVANRISSELVRNEAEQKMQNYNKELEEKIKQKTATLKRAFEVLHEQEKFASLGRVTSGVAHEIRNPLNLIVNSGDISRMLLAELGKKLGERHSDEYDLSETLGDLEHAHKIIDQNCKRIARIIDDMIRQGGGGALAKRTFDLSSLLLEARDFAYHASEFKRSGKGIVFKEDFPDERVELELSTDIQSLFVNIFENSFDALQEAALIKKGKEALLGVKIRKLKMKVFVEIFDNGIGMSKEIGNRIFEPFFSTKGPKEGTGLGLALARTIAKKNGGEIDWESDRGGLTKFKVTFPNGEQPELPVQEGAHPGR